MSEHYITLPILLFSGNGVKKKYSLSNFLGDKLIKMVMSIYVVYITSSLHKTWDDLYVCMSSYEGEKGELKILLVIFI